MTHDTLKIQLCRFTAMLLIVTILGVAAACGFGVVYLRQDMAGLARETVQLEQQIKQAERESAALDARIAKAHSPGFLRARVPAGLRETLPSQIVWMPRAAPLAPIDPSRAPGGDAPAAASDETSPRLISFDLALINQQRAAATRSP